MDFADHGRQRLKLSARVVDKDPLQLGVRTAWTVSAAWSTLAEFAIEGCAGSFVGPPHHAAT
jgi:hypothetical protein